MWLGDNMPYATGAEYLNFLKKVTPSNQREYKDQVTRFNLGVAGEADCPVFDGMYEYCQVCIEMPHVVLFRI